MLFTVLLSVNHNTGPGCWERGRGRVGAPSARRSTWFRLRMKPPGRSPSPPVRWALRSGRLSWAFARNWARHRGSSSGSSGCCAPATSFSVPTLETGPPSPGSRAAGVSGTPAGSRQATPSGSVSVPPRRCGPGLSPRFANWHPRLRPATRPDGKRLVASLSEAQAPPGCTGPARRDETWPSKASRTRSTRPGGGGHAA